MPHVIPLNDSLDTVKRLWLHPDTGGGTLQHFTKAGRVDIKLTAEELELVRTCCLIPDCDCIPDEQRWTLTTYSSDPATAPQAGTEEEPAEGEGFDLEAYLHHQQKRLDRCGPEDSTL